MCLFLFSCFMDLHNVARDLFSLEKGNYSSVLQSCLAAIGYISTQDYSVEISKLADTYLSPIEPINLQGSLCVWAVALQLNCPGFVSHCPLTTWCHAAAQGKHSLLYT